MNYDTPQGKSMFGTDFKYVDENAVRLDLDDLGGEIVSCIFSYFHYHQSAMLQSTHIVTFLILLSVYLTGGMEEMTNQQSRNQIVTLLLRS